MAKRGRQPLYTPERVAKICKALENGETKEKAAKMAGIVPQTFCRWMNEKSEFREAVKKSLKTLICGQEYEEIKTEYENDKTGNPRIRKQTRVTKKVLPNPTAVIFALCNRDPEHWQNRVANEISGKLQTENTGAGVSLANVPDSLLAQVINAINGK